jgi:hypothetical protein
MALCFVLTRFSKRVLEILFGWRNINVALDVIYLRISRVLHKFALAFGFNTLSFIEIPVFFVGAYSHTLLQSHCVDRRHFSRQ